MQTYETINEIYETLADFFPDLGWWPGESEVEKIVGMILAQNTNFNNVELALANLTGYLSIEQILAMPDAELEQRIRPSGYFKQKAKKLKIFMTWLIDQGGIEKLKQTRDTEYMRTQLLAVYGIGEETADSILLYILNHKKFISDAYARRIFGRYLAINIKSYRVMNDGIGVLFERHLNVQALQQFHGMIDETAKQYCTKQEPKCLTCPLKVRCKFANGQV